MLLANKVDIAEAKPERRMILYDEGETICNEQGIYWGGECSAKTFDEKKIKEIFEKFIKQIYLKLGNDSNNSIQNIIKMNGYIKPKKKKGNACC